jgi:hypothetical protein
MGYNSHANVFELFDFVKRQKYLSVKRDIALRALTASLLSSRSVDD